jgi:hypothetical protein
MLQQGENHGKEDTLLHAEYNNGDGCDARKGEFAGLATSNLS